MESYGFDLINFNGKHQLIDIMDFDENKYIKKELP